MEVSDLFLAPIYLMALYLVAYMVRPSVTNYFTKPFFFPALTLKFVGAVGLGLIYQFYYGGGDTFNYFYHTKVIHSAFDQSFSTGWKLLIDNGGDNDQTTAQYVGQMFWHQAGSSEFLLSRVAAFLGLFCFNNYTVIALLFASISFSGMWAMYMTFAKIRPQIYKQLAWAVFYVPSLFFWGSGLLKDSLCIGALGWLYYALYKGAIQRRAIVYCALIGGFAAYTLFNVKVYILLCFLPAALLWVFNETNARIKNQALRLVAKPLFLTLGAGLAFYAATNLTKGDDKYDVDKIGERSKITADYLYEQSVKQEGSGYYLGELDGSIGSMVKLAPQAIATSLYRPFLWEAHNPVMFLSSLEAGFFLFFTLRIFWRTGIGRTLSIISQTPVLLLCFVFALVFAASVGITSANFGTLVRYKIPMIPFYLAGLYILESMAAQPIQKGRQTMSQPHRPQLV
ncbi:hypothetical protein AUC43_19650 [Hymenobacter sedentarius]|uniref:Glycosyltransferase RgtA/B/C/D-like domain-containing protein n=1 Tax=Hymenobacter sedentarius TaxID=1411621 RepID=A0A0U3SLQ8_9BACT|nr:hypothetical protein [Hymenobacter sedentarius]ALW87092.1 hypothetical protein AUC43_19650 [Hymenobacter sedentarius]